MSPSFWRSWLIPFPEIHLGDAPLSWLKAALLKLSNGLRNDSSWHRYRGTSRLSTTKNFTWERSPARVEGRHRGRHPAAAGGGEETSPAGAPASWRDAPSAAPHGRLTPAAGGRPRPSHTARHDHAVAALQLLLLGGVGEGDERTPQLLPA